MTLADLVARYRVAANDLVAPHFCTDEEVTTFLNEAQNEAAIRGRMLRTTAEAEPAVCEIDVTAGASLYSLHPALYELSYQAWRASGETVRTPLALVTREWLDRNVLYWRDMPQDAPRYIAKDGHSLQLVPAPAKAGEILLEGYRTPLERMTDDTDEPAIPALHHIHLVQWALYRAFSKPDADLFDPSRAAMAEAEFTRYFGARPDSDLRSDTRCDEIQHNVAW
ncbi:MAG: hypothetical protein RBT81_13110 [Gammaproteobacteria bacterium]|jgi:hypothetical protein|nr:hypothetical protein [Gammaproteobacteria bacterium]